MYVIHQNWKTSLLSSQKVDSELLAFSSMTIVGYMFIGATPLVPILRQVLQDKRNQIHERKLLILIATDGIPTDERERPDIHTLQHVLRSERKPTNLIPVTIIACTGRNKRKTRKKNQNLSLHMQY